MAKDLKCTVDELIANKELRQKINISDYLTPTVGLPTLQDILQELDKPGRDPRKTIKVFEFDKNVRTINDLREGMILPGIVGNITNFGAFVEVSRRMALYTSPNWPNDIFPTLRKSYPFTSKLWSRL